jgi:hypothetical protein
MARLVPDDLDEHLSDPVTHEGERHTLLRLRDELPDDLTVYHAVNWVSASEGGSVYGEIDFIVANRYGKLLAIEQKDASVYVADNDLRVDYRHQRGKSIPVQVARNIGALRRQFSRRHDGQALCVDHLLYLPQSFVSGQLPASVDPSRVVDASRSSELCAVIGQLFDAAPMPSEGQAADALLVHEFLTEQVQAVPHIGLLGKTAREATSRVSGGLATWVSRLSLHPHRLHVRGTAGSGKTQLAMQELRQAARLGQMALYICYNRPLADAVKAVAPESVPVVTIHEFARELGESAGETFDFAVAGVYDRMIQALLTYAPQIKDAFDVLVVDEAQDMDESWVKALISMAKRDARITVLADPEQSLYARAAFTPDWTTIESPVNYRSPRTLVEFMNHLELCDRPIEAGSTIVGFDPMWHWYADQSDMMDQTEQALKDLIDRGFAPENIVILTYQGLANSTFFASDAPRGLNQIALKRQDGYDPAGQVKYTDGRVLVETLYRFKGQAADAVILTEVDFEELDDKNRRKLFVALSRARLHVTYITSVRARDVLLQKLDPSYGGP